LLPAVQSAREAARRTQCTNNVKQLVLACHNYESTYKRFPAGGVSKNNLAWRCYILPYIEQQALYDQLQSTNAFDGGHFDGSNGNRGTHLANAVAVNPVEAFFCPSCDIRQSWKAPYPTSGALDTGEVLYVAHYIGVAGPLGNRPDRSIYPRIESLVNHVYGGMALDGLLTANEEVPIRK